MKKILRVFTLLIFLVVISGCGLLSPAKVKMLYPIESEDLYFEDDLIKISFVFYKNKIYYEIENKCPIRPNLRLAFSVLKNSPPTEKFLFF